MTTNRLRHARVAIARSLVNSAAGVTFNTRPLFLLLAAIGCLSGTASVVAQEFPTKPIRLIVPNNPGTTSDLVGRLMATGMSKFLGQPVIVENKPGANTIIGSEYVAKQAPADGYTIVVSFVEGLAALPLTVKDLRFDPLKDLPPVIGLVLSSAIIASSSSMPWTTVRGMVAYSRANPGKLNYGAPSSNVRLPTEAVVRGLGINAVHVPYSGGAPYLNALVSGEIHLGFLSEASVNTLGDKVRVLAVSGKRLHAKYPDVPTLADLGFPELQGNNASLNVRLGTPQVAIDKLYLAASQALLQPEMVARFDAVQFEIVNDNPVAAAKKLGDVAKAFADIARKVGIQPQ